MRKPIVAGIVFCAIVLLFVASRSQADDQSTSLSIGEAEHLFVSKVKPLFIRKCGGCHGDEAEEIKGEYDMRDRTSLTNAGCIALHRASCR